MNNRRKSLVAIGAIVLLPRFAFAQAKKQPIVIGWLATLLFVARPIAVLASLLPDRRGQWTRQEIVFVGWARETGVVPAALAGIIVADGVEDADLVVVCVAMAIIVTLTLQASTKRWLARRLGLVELTPIDLEAGQSRE